MALMMNVAKKFYLLNVVMLNVIMLNVTMMSVMVPSCCFPIRSLISMIGHKFSWLKGMDYGVGDRQTLALGKSGKSVLINSGW